MSRRTAVKGVILLANLIIILIGVLLILVASDSSFTSNTIGYDLPAWPGTSADLENRIIQIGFYVVGGLMVLTALSAFVFHHHWRNRLDYTPTLFIIYAAVANLVLLLSFAGIVFAVLAIVTAARDGDPAKPKSGFSTSAKWRFIYACIGAAVIFFINLAALAGAISKHRTKVKRRQGLLVTEINASTPADRTQAEGKWMARMSESHNSKLLGSRSDRRQSAAGMSSTSARGPFQLSQTRHYPHPSPDGSYRYDRPANGGVYQSAVTRLPHSATSPTTYSVYSQPPNPEWDYSAHYSESQYPEYYDQFQQALPYTGQAQMYQPQPYGQGSIPPAQAPVPPGSRYDYISGSPHTIAHDEIRTDYGQPRHSPTERNVPVDSGSGYEYASQPATNMMPQDEMKTGYGRPLESPTNGNAPARAADPDYDYIDPSSATAGAPDLSPNESRLHSESTHRDGPIPTDPDYDYARPASFSANKYEDVLNLYGPGSESSQHRKYSDDYASRPSYDAGQSDLSYYTHSDAPTTSVVGDDGSSVAAYAGSFYHARRDRPRE
ncbi:hypothetical protein DFJ77DRAFT_473097 [Powellomyces hirtus]|nr:hypothetical protein DFJ77DRAFT_473097 [Powellomyces hirtus]